MGVLMMREALMISLMRGTPRVMCVGSQRTSLWCWTQVLTSSLATSRPTPSHNIYKSPLYPNQEGFHPYPQTIQFIVVRVKMKLKLLSLSNQWQVSSTTTHQCIPGCSIVTWKPYTIVNGLKNTILGWTSYSPSLAWSNLIGFQITSLSGQPLQ